MSAQYYGKLDSEKQAEHNLVCRKIVKEITDFGVTQNQILMIIYLLALQLEDQEHLRAVTEVVKEIQGTFLTDPNGEQNG